MTIDKDETLKEEYFKIQEQIEMYDEKALTIKAWSVTISITGLGAGFYEDAPELFLVSSVSAILFWGIEVYWKFFQRAFYERVQDIESYFANGKKDIAILQISYSWNEAFGKMIKNSDSYRLLFYPHVMLPHSIVCAGGFLIYFFFGSNIAKI